MIRVKILADTGDSGGPVYGRSGSSWGPVRAVGLVSAQYLDTPAVIAVTPIETIENQLDGHVVTVGMSICRD